MSPSFTPNWLSGAPAFVLWARRASSPRDLSRARISLTVMPTIIRATLSKPTMRELKWLESLAPKPPPVDADQRGNLQLLEIIQENTEARMSERLLRGRNERRDECYVIGG